MKKLILFSFIIVSVIVVEAQGGSMRLKNLSLISDRLVEPGAPVVRTISLPGRLKLEYAEQGDPAGTPVIFLHGFTDSWHSFEMIFQHLPAHIHAYALSLRGHGDSDDPQSGYSPVDFATDVISFMDELRINSAFVVGHSMGATIAQRFALDFPERTRGLLMIGAFASFPQNVAVAELNNEVGKLSDPVNRSFGSEFQKSTLAQPIAADWFDTLVNESLKLPARVWKATLGELVKADYTQELRRLNKPTLVIWGTRDILTPRADQDLLVSIIPLSKLKIYEGAGHAVHWEEPGRVAGDLESFIKINQ
jgi:pimeloyl-ACP methyl ester carboxylesterase